MILFLNTMYFFGKDSNIYLKYLKKKIVLFFYDVLLYTYIYIHKINIIL